MEITFGKPYWEDGIIRTFDPTRDDKEFVWHRDMEDREIEVLEGEGWQLQIEDCLPFLLELDEEIHIPKMVYHRLIKGYNTLRIEIK